MRGFLEGLKNWRIILFWSVPVRDLAIRGFFLANGSKTSFEKLHLKEVLGGK